MDRGRRRATLGAARAMLLAALVLLLAGCAGGNAKPSKSFAERPATGLATRLEAPPKYSGPGASSWARDYTPTTGQFVEHFYPSARRNQVRAQLEQQGLIEVVHTLWITDENIQNDIVVLHFDTSRGAAERVNVVQTANSGNGALKSYTIDSPAAPVVFYSDRAVSNGYLQANAYAQFGPYVIEMFTFAPTSIPRPQIERWLRDQVNLLS